MAGGNGTEKKKDIINRERKVGGKVEKRAKVGKTRTPKKNDGKGRENYKKERKNNQRKKEYLEKKR